MGSEAVPDVVYLAGAIATLALTIGGVTWMFWPLLASRRKPDGR